MNQPITPTPPVFTQTPVEPEPVKKSYSWLIVVIIIFLLAGSSVLAYKYYQLKQQVTQTPTKTSPSSTPFPETPPANPMANWKTYTSTEFGFQIKYPDNWSIKEDKSLQGLALITVTIGAPSQNALLDIWIRNGTWSQVEGELKAKSTKTVINGIEGLAEPAGDGKVYTFPAKKNDQIIQIVYGSSSDSSSDEIKILDQILSTFKFVDQNSQTSSCTPKFKVESGPELTASEAYSQKCYEAKTKEECEKVDIYRESTQNFGNSDGIPDCLWSNQFLN